MKRHAMCALLSAVLVATGCGPRMELPQGYVRLENPGYLWTDRAVSADGVYLAARKAESAEKGDLDFWAAAVRNELTQARGYTLDAEAPITGADGTVGRRMDFTATVEQATLGYVVAVWVRADRVVVAEAGGPKDRLDADRPAIEEALATVPLR